jgi:hypothetical protein
MYYQFIPVGGCFGMFGRGAVAAFHPNGIKLRNTGLVCVS